LTSGEWVNDIKYNKPLPLAGVTLLKIPTNGETTKLKVMT
jgi:hypothetical protein